MSFRPPPLCSTAPCGSSASRPTESRDATIGPLAKRARQLASGPPPWLLLHDTGLPSHEPLL
eukprot:7873039-Pyramimonas_sp.AAC.1